MARVIVNIDVERLDDAIRFYTAAFELRIGRRFGRAGVELVGAECAIYLIVAEPGSKPFPAAVTGRAYDRHWTPVHLDFVVTGLDAAVQRAQAHGATLEQGIKEQEWGRIAILADPFGHGLCLLEFQGRGYDAISGSTPAQ